jgi:DNA-directed RNA polymerase specialized sigma24 family protein
LRDLKVQDKNKLLYIEAILQQDDSSDWIDIEMLDQIKESIDSLPSQMALIFKLKYLEGKKNKEISALLNVSKILSKPSCCAPKRSVRTMLAKTLSLYFFL